LRPSNLRILLIDNDKEFVSAFADQLKAEFNHDAFIVPSAIQATQMLATMSKGVDVILVDYEMPEMDGLEFLRWMKKNNNQTPVVMLTAAGSELVAVEAMKLGAYDYVRKEHLDLKHLGHVLEATSERHQFRITQEFDEEQLREIGLNRQATDKARDVLNTITPPLNTALANIDYEIEVKGEEVLQELDPSSREKVKILFQEVLKEIKVLEMSVRGLLTLYRILYAHHKEEEEIEEIRKDVEETLKVKQRS
jgi:DNA-binding response OmpR family regulator